MELEWMPNGVPIATRFDDPYFSVDNGLEETTHVFLQGNDLPARFRDGFHVAELGFGTGLNLLVTLRAWRLAGIQGKLRFTSFEAFPIPPADMVKALEQFPALGPLVEEIAPQFGQTQIETNDLCFTLIEGDARDTLPSWNQQADAWFLDGFSPAKNPELWGADLLRHVFQNTAPNGTFATYTAAGYIRQSLTDAGFDVERVSGYGRKRHMSKGVKL